MSVDVSMALPPAYSSDSLDALISQTEAPELPTYTCRSTPPPWTQAGRQPHKEFTTELSRKGKTWAVLTMLADATLSGIPTILEGSDVIGSVKLKLDKDDGIHSVIVSVSIIPQFRLVNTVVYFLRG